MEVDDRLAFPVFQPPISRDFAVVFIGLPIPLLPLLELVFGKVEPDQQLLGRQFAPFEPVLDVINNLVSRVMRNPATCQSSPFSFFERMFSSISSEMTSFLESIFSRSCWMVAA